MLAAYESGDAYIAFGKQIGALPADAAKKTHEAERQLYKACVLGVIYGMERRALAMRIGRPPIVARDWLRAHREVYQKFWRWSDAAVDYAMLTGSLHTVFGWRVHVGENVESYEIVRNFPMQANGAEMLAAPSIRDRARDAKCAPRARRHTDCAPLDRLDADAAEMQRAMTEASRIVLDGFEIMTEVKVIRYPDRYMDKRGVEMWNRVIELIDRRQWTARGEAAVG